MTHPTEVKPREGEQPGTTADQFEVGATLPDLSFTVTPEIIRQYMTAIDAEEYWYEVEGRGVAPPNVLAVYLLAILYRRFPPAQGIILAKQTWEFAAPIWADEATDIVGNGVLKSVEERRGKQFVRWAAEFRRVDGELVASAENELYVPSEKESMNE